MRLATLTALLMLGCNDTGPGIINNPDDLEPDQDTEPPVVTTDPIEDAQILGEDVLIDANAIDELSSVVLVTVHYKQETSTVWDDVILRQVDTAGNWTGYIPGNDVASAGMDYYISAIDGAENEGFAPEDGEDDPYHFRISTP